MSSTTGSPAADGTQSGGNEGNERRNRRFRRGNNTLIAHSRQQRFEGRCVDLKGHIYDCGDIRQADQYARTTMEIAEYVGRTYKYGMDIRLSIENMTMAKFELPEDPPTDATRTEIRLWEKRIDDYALRENTLKENIKTTYSLIWSQCSDAIRQKIEATEDFSNIAPNGNAIELLKIIKDIAYNFQSQKYMPHALHEAKKRLYNCYQARHTTTQAYLESFQNCLDVVNHIGGTIGGDPAMIDKVAKQISKDKNTLTEAEIAMGQEEYIATAFLLGADRSRFGK